MIENLIDDLKKSEDPSIRYYLCREYLGMDPDSPELRALQVEVRDSPPVQALLADRSHDGRLPRNAYAKWKGAFWVLLQMVDLGYPAGDGELIPLRDQVLEWLLDEDRLNRIPLIKGLYRRCALQESSIVYSMIKLDIVDQEAIQKLFELLLKWQWPDGGWNCDKKPEASHSSFHESLIPLRAMQVYYEYSADTRAKAAVERSSEVFLKRRLFRRVSDGSVILPEFTELRYPPYWHYDILTGLTAMHEAGRLSDPRCAEALDLLESKQLPGGGWPAERKYYRVTLEEGTGVSPVGWGPVGRTRRNDHVTVRALAVLKHAGRIQ
jgi:hypothetical protein